MALLDENDPISKLYLRIIERLILLSEEQGVDFETLYNEFFNLLEQELLQYEAVSNC